MAVGMSPSVLSLIRFRFSVTVAASIGFILVGYNKFPFELPIMNSVSERLIFTIRCQIFGALMILMGIHGVGKIRGMSDAASDPVYGNGEHLVYLPKRILQNTVEQFVFHFIGQLALCTYLSPEAMKMIPVLVALFVIARIIFNVTYQIDAMLRIYGSMSTFIPTVGVYGYCLYCFLTQ